MSDANSWWRFLLRGFLRVVVTAFLRSFYRIRTCGIEQIPASSGAILASNHVSWLDGLILMLVSPRPLRMIVYEGNFSNAWLRSFAMAYDAILIGANPKSIARGLQQARQALLRGELVGIFPEGGISRTGQLNGFRRGITTILKGTDVPVVPVHIDGMWGSIFSFSGGRFFFKWPARWPLNISIDFGTPIDGTRSAFEVRQAVQALSTIAMSRRVRHTPNLVQRAIRGLKKRRFRSALADSLGTELTGGMTLLRAIVLRRLIRRVAPTGTNQRIGVLLPPSVAGAVTNLALSLDRRIVVNLNYSLSLDSLQHCVAVAGIRHVITSRNFRERFTFDLPVEWVMLEDLRDQPTTIDKAVAFLQAYLFPAWLLDSIWSLSKLDPHEEMTTIFTSGSTGVPKGVVLTYANVGSNVQAIQDVIHLVSSDVLIGILPFFHAFGYTVTLWCVLGLDIKGIYHYNPLEAQQIGKLSRRHKATILVSTPTFLRPLVARCESTDFASLNVVVTGAERLSPLLADAFHEKFAVRPVEGYGTTELSPLVSVNVPASRQLVNFQALSREGTVGRPVPGIAARILNLETDQAVGANCQGMLYIAGPNVMKGYLNDVEATKRVLNDGWYKTGDLAMIDDDGFIVITGRESRFSKLAGEMVPHGLIEDALQQIVGDDADAPPRIAVTSLPDPKKGERLVVVHTPLDRTPGELCERLRSQGIANLWVPAVPDFVEVEAIPLLGTGKTDLRAVREIAQERLGTR
ncbi:MAG: AMP-binding protein [Planctomycetota bacterium]|nr:AMP-binding protein [Planctomycetota bacterium]MDA1178327.1 AMP-binding protein [Planctomycetota bacterium]